LKGPVPFFVWGNGVVWVWEKRTAAPITWARPLWVSKWAAVGLVVQVEAAGLVVLKEAALAQVFHDVVEHALAVLGEHV
jgi:hypothetical protein